MIVRKTVEATIGKTFADNLDSIIIDISPRLTYTRRDMVEKLGCANFLAAYRLQRVLKRHKIETPTQLFKTDSFSIIRAKGIGQAAIFVAMCILDHNGYNVETWWTWGETNPLKFSAFKHNAMRRASKRGKHE